MKENCRRALTVVCCLTALVLVSCELMSASQQRPEKVVSKLSPANATFDLEDEGLKVLWPQELGQLSEGKSLRSICVAGKFVVIETDDNVVHCLDASSGTWRGTESLLGKVQLPPVAVGNTIFFVTKGALVTFDVAHDRLSRPYHPGFALFAKPIVYHDLMILSGGDGRLETVHLSGTGQEWMTSLRGTISEPPVVSGSTLYASAHSDSVVVWDLARNEEVARWQPLPPSKIASGVAVYDDKMVFVGDDRGMVYARSADLSKEAWQTMLPAPIVGKPQVVGEQLLVITSQPELVCFNVAGQEPVWRREGVEKLLTVGQRGLYVLEKGNVLAVLSMETGKPVWTDTLPKDCQVIGDPTRPILYLANKAGSILALQELD